VAEFDDDRLISKRRPARREGEHDSERDGQAFHDVLPKHGQAWTK
jgi:hypothetical protein